MGSDGQAGLEVRSGVSREGWSQRERVGLETQVTLVLAVYVMSTWWSCDREKVGLGGGATCLHIQRLLVNVDVQPVGSVPADVLQHAVQRPRQVVGYPAGKLRPAVHHHTAAPEVQDLQLLEARQIGLQVGQQLQGEEVRSQRQASTPYVTTRCHAIGHHFTSRAKGEKIGRKGSPPGITTRGQSYGSIPGFTTRTHYKSPLWINNQRSTA